jgi:hypothetical protein
MQTSIPNPAQHIEPIIYLALLGLIKVQLELNSLHTKVQFE